MRSPLSSSPQIGNVICTVITFVIIFHRVVLWDTMFFDSLIGGDRAFPFMADAV
jgi:hypothetical protein